MIVPGRKGNWMQTYTGKAFWPADPRPEEMFIEDIAHALSQQNRYAGHTRVPYSVAEHSVRVSWIVPAPVAFEALLHDATEAYLVDLPRPVKDLDKFPGTLGAQLGREYKQLEDQLALVVAERFRLVLPFAAEVHHADQVLLATEKRDLMRPAPYPWITLPDPLPDVIQPWSPIAAKARFLARFRQLARVRGLEL